MGTAFSVSAQLNLPGAPGLALDAIVHAVSSTYDSKAVEEYSFPASSSTQVVPFGTLPAAGAKLVLVAYEAATASVTPVTVAFNSQTPAIALQAGSFLVYANPSPAAGITALTLGYTGIGRVRVWLLG